MNIQFSRLSLLLPLLALITYQAAAQNLNNFHYMGPEKVVADPKVHLYQFNGYTNHWQDNYKQWIHYGNLYKTVIDDIEYSILQSKLDIAEDMGLPGLQMQEGFLKELISVPYQVMDHPDKSSLLSSLKTGNVLVLIDPESEIGKELTADWSQHALWPIQQKSHQYGDLNLKRIDALMLHNGKQNLFVVSSKDHELINKFCQLIENTKKIVAEYDLHKGWFGAYSLLKSVTITPGHPLEIIGKGMNEGNSWFVFDGYMDFLIKEQLEEWMKEVNLPIVADVGYAKLYGCDDYEGFQVQRMFTKETWFDYARQKNGYVFRNVYDQSDNPYPYDGYIAQEGNKTQIDNENIPFILKTGKLEDDALSSMVLFVEKGEPFTLQSMWESIMDVREVGILAQGKMIGPSYFRNALQMLLLDKIFLEDYFMDKLNLRATVEKYELKVSVTNLFSHDLTGELEVVLPDQLSPVNSNYQNVLLPAQSTQSYSFKLRPNGTAMGKTNPIAVHYIWNGNKKSTLAMLDLPPAISAHQLLYGHAPKVNFPVTLHNFSNETSFSVKVQVMDQDELQKVIFSTEKECRVEQASFKDILFELDVSPGSYTVEVSSLGQKFTTQLGVGKATGNVTIQELDVDGDGNNEFLLENDSVQITLLATGARVIKYVVKSRKDNIFSTIWPEKAIDDKRPYRKRGFYPYGGFEDFLGQASMETHQVYDAEIIQGEGDYARVMMWSDYFGNRIEKTFTLYGNSPLLEIRFALTFKDPYANVLGPQPILELGDRHWTEDVFTLPTVDGIKEIRMTPERRWGQIFYMKEGWNAGYDTREDVTFVGAMPVSQPLFMHMFLNDPYNKDAHHYYAEFQPWVPIIQKSTMYFSYYIWGAGGPWNNGVNALRKRNLVTVR